MLQAAHHGLAPNAGCWLDTAEDHWSLIETESLIKSLMQQTYKKEESGNIVDQC